MTTTERRLPIRPAGERDYQAVAELLRAADLPLAGVTAALTGFYVAEEGGRVLGAIGLEVHGEDGLLRSAVVDPAAKGTGVGHQLVDRILAHARERGLGAVYLLTTTADGYFPRFGFTRIGREEVPDPVQASVEFREACPASAVAMRKSLFDGWPRGTTA